MNMKKLFINFKFIVSEIYGICALKREKKIAELLVRNALKLSVAESCTGGLISSRMTDLSGSSVYIRQNFVTYANEAKVKLLGVNPDTIEKNGVVSSEVAFEMAEGALKRYDCTVTLSATGIAGPLGATEFKPVGLVYFGISDGEHTKTYKYEANSMLYRRLMKYAFSNKALDCLLEFLKEYY